MTSTLATGAESLEIRWSDGSVGQFPYIWLRDSDASSFHAKTGERDFDLTSVDLDLTPHRAEITPNALFVTWTPDGVPSRFDLNWIKAHRPGQARADPADIAPVPWRAELGERGVPRSDADSLMASGEALADWLEDTKRFGLSLVTGLADDPEAGQEIARRIGHLRETNFGVTFEVMSKPDPVNLAYTADALPLHTDLPNQEAPPGYQFLHCLANEAEGGGSTFCDGAAVAEDLRTAAPEAFELLSTVSVPFRFHDADTDIRSRKRVIELGARGEVREVCFNAHIADVLDLEPARMMPFYRAYRRFMQMTRDSAYGLALRLSGGEMVVFDNRRVMHGRAAFDPSTGRRHLRGCYVDRGEWDSRLRVLRRSRP